MSKYSRKNKISDETRADAMKVARGTQRPGQTKEQTKLIAQGIQKGIDLYKKQQKNKARELDKKLRKITNSQASEESSSHNNIQSNPVKSSRLAWVLLVLSWIGFAVYLVLSKSLPI